MDFNEGVLALINIINQETKSLAARDGKNIVIRTPEGNKIKVKVVSVDAKN
jgi:hypothetical protein